jgi:hypothetical protein
MLLLGFLQLKAEFNWLLSNLLALQGNRSSSTVISGCGSTNLVSLRLRCL